MHEPIGNSGGAVPNEAGTVPPQGARHLRPGQSAVSHPLLAHRDDLVQDMSMSRVMRPSAVPVA